MTQNWTLTQAQEAVDNWISQWEEGYWSPLSNLARLTEEVGELAREINQTHGEKPTSTSETPANPNERIADEMGDILFVLITMANSLDIDLDQSLRQVLEKYNIRDGHRFTPKK